MTTYNTGNPLGSVDPRDLYDNSENLDDFSNGPLNFYTDRLGVSRESLRGIRNASQYQIIGAYASGLVFTAYNQTFSYLGDFYAPSAGLALPYTTTGAGAGEIASFRNVGDALLRSDLAASGGSSLVGVIQSGTGAGFRTVAESLSETIKLTQYIQDGETTAEAAFSRAIASFTRPGTLEVPQGFFNIAAMVEVRTDIPIKIKGAGMNSTIIYYSGAGLVQSMFKQSGSIVDTFELSDMTLLGNNKAGSGYLCEQIIAATFKNLSVQTTTVSALRINDGYSNTFDNVKLFLNSGGGISCTGVNNNNVNIQNSQIYENDGIGVEIGNGFSVTIRGCDIETNKIAGVMAYDLKVFTIRDSYIERNASVGYAYTTGDGSPENITIKSDIHLLSGGKTIGGTKATAVTQANIDSVQFTPYGTGDVPTSGLSIDSVIFSTVTDGLRVTNCEVLDPAKIKQLVSFYQNNTKSSVFKCVIDGNTVDTIGFLGTENTSFGFNTMHNVDVPSKPTPCNYVSQDLSDYTIIAGASGSFRRAANNRQNYPVYAIASGDYIFGYDIDLTKNPELKGQIVWFGLWYNVADTGSTVQLFLGGRNDTDGTATDAAMSAGVYAFKSICKKVLAGDTTLFVAVRRVGSGANPVLVSAPVVSLAGFGANRYPIPISSPVWKSSSPPSTGTWEQRDRVVNGSPVVGDPKAWVCTVAGTPGTWVSEGNL